MYVLGHSEGTLIEGNTFSYVAPYRGYGWGIYLDEGASGVVARGNLVFRAHSASLHQHFGFNNTISGNIFACAGGADGDLALSIGEPHSSFHFTHNVVLRCPPAQSLLKDEAEATTIAAVVASDGTVTGDQAAYDARSVSAAPFPLAPSWMFWWKGEGSSPELVFDHNVYYSTVPEECLSPTSAPPSVHFIKRGRTLRGWQKSGQDLNSVWADPGFRDVGSCDFRLADDSLALKRGLPPLIIPEMARGLPAGGDGAGCGEPAPPGHPTPSPDPLQLLPIVAEDVPAVKALSKLVPNGVWILKRHVRAMKQRAIEERQQLAAQQEALESMRYHAQMHLHSYGTPCWVEPKLGKKAKYLPGCTQDGCAEHTSLAEAAAVCELLGDGCGGVTADASRALYQTRVGPNTRDGPQEEESWRKRPC